MANLQITESKSARGTADTASFLGLPPPGTRTVPKTWRRWPKLLSLRGSRMKGREENVPSVSQHVLSLFVSKSVSEYSTQKLSSQYVRDPSGDPEVSFGFKIGFFR